ncbi:Nucleoid occlusion protein [subsurface metagenome]
MYEIVEIPIEKIKVGEHEQRLDMQDPGVSELAASIRRIGILSPLLVVTDGDDVLLIAGHRRLVAARLAGLKIIPCIVRASEKGVDEEVTFAENFFRRDLSPVELACAIKDCMQGGVMTVKELAAGFHKTERWVYSMIDLAEWPDDVLEAIHIGKISVAAAENLVEVNDKEYRKFLLRNAMEQGASAKATAGWLQQWRSVQTPQEQIQTESVGGSAPITPLVPQAPCLCCSQTFPVNEMSHVPLCGACIQILRVAGTPKAAMNQNQTVPQGPGQVS